VVVRDRCTYSVCFFDAFAKCNYVRSIVMYTSIIFFMDLPQYTIQYHNIYSLTQNAAHISDTVSVWAETVHNSTQLVVHT
jgi:hypothetical protein